jgi:hypothetical protein
VNKEKNYSKSKFVIQSYKNNDINGPLRKILKECIRRGNMEDENELLREMKKILLFCANGINFSFYNVIITNGYIHFIVSTFYLRSAHRYQH